MWYFCGRNVARERMICIIINPVTGWYTMSESVHREVIMTEKVREALNGIRPMLQRDGGDVELVEVTPDGTVKVRLKGACGTCPMSTMTLKSGIEARLKEQIPEIKEVVSV